MIRTLIIALALGQIQVKDEGSVVGSVRRHSIDCRGSGISCTMPGGATGDMRITVSGSGGGAGGIDQPTADNQFPISSAADTWAWQTADVCTADSSKLEFNGTTLVCDTTVHADALAANPAACGANQFVNDIAADGTLTCAALVDADIPNTITVDLATAATALASNPSDCAANQFAQSIAASGNLTCAAIADADVPNNITVDLAATATALAANPADCGANTFATAIAANGDLTCSAASVVECIYIPAWSWVAQVGTTTTTTQCTATTNLGSVANRGHQFFVDMDRYTHAKLRFWGNKTGAQTGTITVALRDIGAGTDDISTTAVTGTSCADFSTATTDLTAKTGVVQYTVRLGDSTAADDPALSTINVEFCTGSF